MMEWRPVFRAGRTRLNVAFTGGHLSAGGCTPASFETSDPVVQTVIENSLPFRRGQIKVVGGGHPDRLPAGPVTGTGAPHDQTMEFETLGAAQDFLQSSKSVAIDEMLTLKDCVAMGARLGIRMTIKNAGTV